MCCPDSKIAKDIKCGRTKATQLTKELGSKSSQSIVNDLKSTKFSLIVEQTTDVSNRKALVLVARYFHALTSKQFFIADMWRRMEQHPALLQQRPAAPSAAAPVAAAASGAAAAPAVAAPAAAASGAAAPANQH
ncbi:hypothetical protein ACLKA6_013897 [Drosophila palustris]